MSITLDGSGIITTPTLSLAGSVSTTGGDINLITAVALTDAAATLTAAQLTGSRVFTITPTVARTLTTDTAANIIAALGGNVVGSNQNFRIINTAAFDVTLAAGAGVTLTGKTVINNGSGVWTLRVDSASAVTIFTDAAVLAVSGVPTGTITMFGSATPPSGYLSCDASAVSRTTYAALFAVISTTWGVGDGSTTFNVPDLRGRAPIGSGTGSGLTARTIAATGGAETHVLSTDEMPSHTHDIRTRTGGTTGTSQSWVQPSTNSGTYTDRTVTGAGLATGGGAAHNNMQPFAVCLFIIKT